MLRKQLLCRGVVDLGIFEFGIARATLINLRPDFSPQSALPYYFSRFPAENALFQSGEKTTLK
jgi:hypothetical protein